ncbi:MAG: putative sugar O-methyltransferase [Deltaproteobacteria bacterium]|nr:MAG: putative sugar O-methyltransferase [Deltaproteobacteria bacterium]
MGSTGRHGSRRSRAWSCAARCPTAPRRCCAPTTRASPSSRGATAATRPRRARAGRTCACSGRSSSVICAATASICTSGAARARRPTRSRPTTSRATARSGCSDALTEDGAFGAVTFEIDGRRVSRDLLDSALEIEALAAWLGADALAAARVLDVGAGYGRLAHRLCSWAPRARVVATDAVPLSTFPCEYYLGHRGCTNAQVGPLDEAEALIARGGFDLAVNVHSFGEAPRAAVAWWLERIAAAGVPRLFIVHVERELFALEDDLSRKSYDDVLARLG